MQGEEPLSPGGAWHAAGRPPIDADGRLVEEGGQDAPGGGAEPSSSEAEAAEYSSSLPSFAIAAGKGGGSSPMTEAALKTRSECAFSARFDVASSLWLTVDDQRCHLSGLERFLRKLRENTQGETATRTPSGSPPYPLGLNLKFVPYPLGSSSYPLGWPPSIHHPSPHLHHPPLAPLPFPLSGKDALRRCGRKGWSHSATSRCGSRQYCLG